MKSKTTDKLVKRLRKKRLIDESSLFAYDAIKYITNLLNEAVVDELEALGYCQCDLCGKWNKEDDMINLGEDAEDVCPDCIGETPEMENIK